MTDSSSDRSSSRETRQTRHTVVVPNSVNMVSLLGPGHGEESVAQDEADLQLLLDEPDVLVPAAEEGLHLGAHRA